MRFGQASGVVEDPDVEPFGSTTQSFESSITSDRRRSRGHTRFAMIQPTQNTSPTGAMVNTKHIHYGDPSHRDPLNRYKKHTHFDLTYQGFDVRLDKAPSEF